MRRLAVAALLLTLTACAPGGCQQTGAPETADTPMAEPLPGDPDAPPAEPGTPPAPEPVTWPHEPGGGLYPGSGTGATDATVWAAGMRFPIEAGPAYANSQVYGYGGYLAPGPAASATPATTPIRGGTISARRGRGRTACVRPARGTRGRTSARPPA